MCRHMKTALNINFVAKKLNAPFRTEFVVDIKKYEEGQFIKYLLESLSTKTDAKELIDYGMINLSHVTRPNNELGFYFLTTSEIQGINEDARDLCLDAMIFCKNEPDFLIPSTLEQIVEKYKGL